MSGTSLTPEALDGAIMLAKERGFEVVTADERTLLLDLDTLEARAQYGRVFPILTEHFGVDSVEEWASKSGNRHVRIRLSLPQSPAVRYGLQAALGSDGVREALILVQHRNGCEEPSILFKPVPASEAAELFA